MMQGIKSISELQEAIKEIILSNEYFTRNQVSVFVENSATIENDLDQALKVLGLGVCVVTPSFDFAGMDGEEPSFKAPSIEIVITENPIINRSRPDAPTALDASLQIANTLALQKGILINDIRQTADNGIVYVTVTIKTQITFGMEKL